MHIEYSYLAFRRLIVFLDEWLSYLLITIIYYHYGERNWFILGPILFSVIAFNVVGYIYLGYLEKNLDIYGFNHNNQEPVK